MLIVLCSGSVASQQLSRIEEKLQKVPGAMARVLLYATFNGCLLAFSTVRREEGGRESQVGEAKSPCVKTRHHVNRRQTFTVWLTGLDAGDIRAPLLSESPLQISGHSLAPLQAKLVFGNPNNNRYVEDTLQHLAPWFVGCPAGSTRAEQHLQVISLPEACWELSGGLQKVIS